MRVTHFVDHPHAAPLCGTPEGPVWIETLRPESVTCPRCVSRLRGVRPHPASVPPTEARGDAV